MSNGGCSHKCVNIAGGFKCECPDPELSMSSDNKTCHGKYKRRNLKKKKKKSVLWGTITWFVMGRQNIQAKNVY